MSHEIYALLDDSGAIRYIGKTRRGSPNRVAGHWSESRLPWKQTPLAQWLRTLDKPPSTRTLVIVEDSEVERLPRPWNVELAAIRAASDHWPGQLLNVQDGRYFPVNHPDIPHHHTAILRSRSAPAITISQDRELPGAGERKPRLLDLFCGAGGASMGYYRAGFEVVGLDIEPQPEYPFTFIQADATTFPLDGFDAVHASPPCQSYSGMTRCRPGLARKYPQLVDMIRDRLQSWGGPWVVENVAGSGLAVQDDLFGASGLLLCGVMFGRELYRHRLFEASTPVPAPGHPRHLMAASKAGHWKPGTVISVAGNCSPIGLAREVMDIDWMTRDRLAESIPPYYTEYIGGHLLEALSRTERAA